MCGGGGGAPSFFLWEWRELPRFFNGREGMTSFFENPRLSSDVFGVLRLVKDTYPHPFLHCIYALLHIVRAVKVV